MRLVIVAAASVALLGLAACEKPGDSTAAKPPPTFSVDYCANESLDAPSHIASFGCLVSPNRQFALLMRPVGALELVKLTPSAQLGSVLWSSDTKGSSPNHAGTELQEDGNLVIYDGNKPIWNSHTAGKPGRYTLALNDQGNAVIKNPEGQTIWAAQFDAKLCPPTLSSPAQLAVDGCLASPNKAFVMTMAKSGALEVTPVGTDGRPGPPIWSSGNHLSGRGPAPFMALQSDGNLVVYVAGKPTWDAKTALGPGVYTLDLADDGELKLHRADGAVIWSSRTGKAKA